MKYDAGATAFLTIDELFEFVGALPKPLGFGGGLYTKRQLMLRVGDIPVCNEMYVHFTGK